MMNSDTPTPNAPSSFDAGAELHVSDPALARWIRAPKGTTPCPHTGLRRTTMYSLIKKAGPRIRVCRMHEQGAKRGCVLFWLPSIMQYLHDMAGEQAKHHDGGEVA